MTAVVRLYSLWPGAQRVGGWDKSAPQAYHEPTKRKHDHVVFRGSPGFSAPQAYYIQQHSYSTYIIKYKIQRRKNDHAIFQEAPQVLVLPRHIDVLNAKSNGGCCYNRVVVAVIIGLLLGTSSFRVLPLGPY